MDRNKLIERYRQRSEANKGIENHFLWTRVNFSTARDGHIRKLGANAFAVFMVIRTYMDKEKIAYPSLARIAYQSNLSVRTVEKALNKLVDEGWIKKVGRMIDKGKFGNTRYLILQHDLIRGTDDPSFMSKPIANIANGNQGNQ
ncbi:helix-turn-helix domain-containing protein [Patescibacteria group bacterium]|nr:helix-turn-helix domain-containing protein [Patescibacteria group bacterium]